MQCQAPAWLERVGAPFYDFVLATSLPVGLSARGSMSFLFVCKKLACWTQGGAWMGSAGEFGVGPQVARYLGFWGALAETCGGQNGLVSRNLYCAGKW